MYQCFFISQKGVFTSLSDSVIFWSWFIVKQYLGLLLNIGINTKDSAFSIFKTARRKYMSLKTLRCLSLSAKGQHWNFVISFFHFYLLFFFLILYLFFHWKILSCFLWSTCIEWEIFCTLVFSVPTIASFQRQVSLTETTQLLSAALHACKQLLLRLWRSLVWGGCGR